MNWYKNYLNTKNVGNVTEEQLIERLSILERKRTSALQWSRYRNPDISGIDEEIAIIKEHLQTLVQEQYELV